MTTSYNRVLCLFWRVVLSVCWFNVSFVYRVGGVVRFHSSDDSTNHVLISFYAIIIVFYPVQAAPHSPRSKFSNFIYSARQTNRNIPVGPCLFFKTVNSAVPLSGESLL